MKFRELQKEYLSKIHADSEKIFLKIKSKLKSLFSSFIWKCLSENKRKIKWFYLIRWRLRVLVNANQGNRSDGILLLSQSSYISAKNIQCSCQIRTISAKIDSSTIRDITNNGLVSALPMFFEMTETLFVVEGKKHTWKKPDSFFCYIERK